MPTTIIKKRTYRKRPTFRKKKPYKKKRRSNSAWHKLSTLGMPFNMITYLQYNSKTMNYNVPQNSPTGTAYWGTNSTSFALGLNLLNPVNLVHAVGLVPQPAADAQYFGSTPTVSSEGVPTLALPNTYTYSQLSWWAQWYAKMRITHVWVKITIRPVQDAPIPNDNPPASSSRDPFSLTILDAKYISNLNQPELLAIQDLDDLRATRGARTMTFSGQRNKPIILKRRISVKRLLGVKDIMDTGYETQCTIHPALLDMTNPTIRNQCFTFLRISRPNISSTVDTTAPMRFAIQFKVVSKVHFSQLAINSPQTLVASGQAPPVEIIEDPNNTEEPPTEPI